MTQADPLGAIRALREHTHGLRAPPEAIRRTQADALGDVLEAAASAGPYRQRFPRKLPVVREPEDVRSLPVVDRAALSGLPLEDRVVGRASPDVRAHSSGTSGPVLECAWSDAEDRHLNRVWTRQIRAQGVRRDARLLYLHVGSSGRETRLEVSGSRAELGAFVPASRIESAVRSFRPEVIAGPPSVLCELGDRVGPYPGEAVLTRGEVLDSEMRGKLRESFGVDPLDQYACIEAGWVSWQCERREGYHVNADEVLVEVLDARGEPAQPGKVGEVVLTALWNRTAPIVRYRVGDTAALLDGSCPCAVRLPLMGQVEGRSNDWIVLADGRRVSPLRLVLTGLVPECKEAVRRYRVLQREPTDFLVEVEWRAGERPDLEERVAEAFAWTLEAPVRVRVRAVDRVGEPGRKHRLVESLVAR